MSATAADIVWTTARDGSRTARVGGKWAGGCSVPRRAAELMLRNLTVKGQVACLLIPTHAQQVAVCLARIDPATALMVLVDSQASLDLIRACHDFTGFENRLFFATDEASLRLIFTRHPGLPIPQQFIRTPVTPSEPADAAIVWAQRVFSDVLADHAKRASVARSGWAPTSDRLCVVVSRRFRLWNDAGDQLARALDADVIDTDLATQTSVALIAEHAQSAAAVVMADVGRADRPELLSPRQPWITWITQPRLPAFLPGSPRDGLIVIDESLTDLALKHGWPFDRVRVGAFPPVARTAIAKPNQPLALIADLPDLAPPAEVQEFSSWRVVWDAIRKDLPDNPHRLAGDIDGYLDKSRRHFGVPADNFPQQTFIDRLIAPAYLIGIARWLVRESIPLTIYGHGWESVEAVRSSHQGAIDSREQLNAALDSASGLIDASIAACHPARSIGVPRVATFGRTPQRIAHEAKAMITGPTLTPISSTVAPLSAPLIRALLG